MKVRGGRAISKLKLDGEAMQTEKRKSVGAKKNGKLNGSAFGKWSKVLQPFGGDKVEREKMVSYIRGNKDTIFN